MDSDKGRTARERRTLFRTVTLAGTFLPLSTFSRLLFRGTVTPSGHLLAGHKQSSGIAGTAILYVFVRESKTLSRLVDAIRACRFLERHSEQNGGLHVHCSVLNVLLQD
jgi:hypothetical protein